MVACEQIIGLDKFKKCDVDITCESDASDAAEVDANDAGDASDAPFILPDGASEASSWPQWRMDNTPAEVEGGAPSASLASFTPSPPYLFDNVSQKNFWCVPQIGKAANVTDAANFCASIQCRLPTRIELVTLLDSTQQQTKVFINPAFQQYIDGGSLWSSSYFRPIDGGIMFWFADLTSGDMLPSTPANVGVLCIH
jgi:hypothetical protein